MMAEFQVFFSKDGLPQSVLIRAPREEQAIEIATALGVTPITVGPPRIVLDPDQQTYDRTQAGAYLGGGPAKVDQLMAEGVLPKAKDGRPIFTRRVLDLVIEKRMGLIEWESNLKKAA